MWLRNPQAITELQSSRFLKMSSVLFFPLVQRGKCSMARHAIRIKPAGRCDDGGLLAAQEGVFWRFVSMVEGRLCPYSRSSGSRYLLVGRAECAGTGCVAQHINPSGVVGIVVRD